MNFQSGRLAFPGQGADDVVRLEARHLQDGDAVGADEVLDNGYSPADVLGRGLALRLVFGIHLVAERAARRVEGDAEIVGPVRADDLLQRVHEAEDRRGVLSF